MRIVVLSICLSLAASAAVAQGKTLTIKQRNRIAALHDKGEKAVSEGRLKEARTYFEHALQIDPDDPHTIFMLGLVALRRSQIPTARKLFRKATKMRPKHGAYWYNLGISLMYDRRGAFLGPTARLGEAQDVLVQSVQLDKTNPEAHYYLGLLFERKRDWPYAKHCFQRAVNIKKDHTEALYHLALSLEYNQFGQRYGDGADLDRAIWYYRKLIKLKPKYGRAYINLAAIYQQQRKYKPALELYQQAERHAGSEPILYQNLVALHLATGQRKKAMAALERLLLLQPKSDNLYLDLARMYREKSEWDLALMVINKGVERMPKSAALHAHLGALQYQRGEPDLALGPLQKAVRLNRRYGLPHYYLGWIWRQKGKKNKAARHYKQFLKCAQDRYEGQQFREEARQYLGL